VHLNNARILARFEICATKLVDSAAGHWVHEWWPTIDSTKQTPWQPLSWPLAWLILNLERTHFQGFSNLEHLPTVRATLGMKLVIGTCPLLSLQELLRGKIGFCSLFPFQFNEPLLYIQ
jgi:hypothetical protein